MENKSKREINQNIDDLFSQNNNKPTNINTTVKRNKKSGSKLPLTVLSIILLAIATYFALPYLNFSKPTHINISSIYQLSAYNYIVATPLITDINDDGRPDICFADGQSTLYAYDAISQKLIFRYFFNSGIIASPFSFDVNNDHKVNLIVSDQIGTTAILNEKGKYLFKSRKEYFDENILTKGAIVTGAEYPAIILCGEKGNIISIEGKYGILNWKNNDSFVSGKKIIASPLVFPINGDKIDDIIIIANTGELSLLDGRQGNEIWHIKLNERIVATPVLGDFINKKELLICSRSGTIYIVSLQSGKITKTIKLASGIVASPFVIQNRNKDVPIILTLDGTIIMLNINNQKDNKIFNTKEKTEFRASPIAADINLDGTPDIIAVNGIGDIYILDGHTLKLIAPIYSLKKEITATPLLGDINLDKNLELIIADESGIVHVLLLNTTPTKIFPKGKIFYSQFLGSPKNINNNKYF